MKRLRLPLLSAVIGLVLLAAPASAQIGVGPNLSFNFDKGHLGIGGNAFIGINVSDYELLANPSVDVYVFNDNPRITHINLDLAYPISVAESFTPFIGAGLLVRRRTFTGVRAGISSDTDVGLNFFAGAFFMPSDSPIRPFAKAVAYLGGGTGLAVQAGASFRISE